MGAQLQLLFHGITVFVNRGRHLEACVMPPAASAGCGGESYHAVVLADKSTIVPMTGRMELRLDRVVTPVYPSLHGAERFLLDGATFDNEEREVEGRMLLPVPDVIAAARYQFHTRSIFFAGEEAPRHTLEPALAHILIYNGVERAQLCRGGSTMWEMPGPLVSGVLTDRYIGPVFPPN